MAEAAHKLRSYPEEIESRVQTPSGLDGTWRFTSFPMSVPVERALISSGVGPAGVGTLTNLPRRLSLAAILSSNINAIRP